MKLSLTLLMALSLVFSSSGKVMAEECGQFLEGSTAWAACNNLSAYEIADNELNDAYQKLMVVMSKPVWREAKNRLIAAQRAWIIFRDRECEFSQELIGGANHVNESECVFEMTKGRAEYINGLYESYK